MGSRTPQPFCLKFSAWFLAEESGLLSLSSYNNHVELVGKLKVQCVKVDLVYDFYASNILTNFP